VPIYISNLDPSLTISDQLPSGKITLVPQPGQDETLASDASLQADFKGIVKPGLYSIPLTVNTPEGFEVEAYEPLALNVRLHSAPVLPTFH